MKRSTRYLKPRDAMFVHSLTGETDVPCGHIDTATLWELLEGWQPFVAVRPLLFIVGPRPRVWYEQANNDRAAWYAWVAWRDGALPPGWQLDPTGHYLSDPESPVLRFLAPGGGRVELRRWHTWVDASEHTTAADAAAAWGALGAAVRQTFNAGVLASPAATGRDLWTRLIPFGIDIEPCSQEVQELIRSTTTQGRTEVFAQADERPITSLCSYDARLAYLGCCARLGYGEPVRSTKPQDLDLYAHGRYLVDFSVPNGWAHPGLLPVLTDDGWRWPTGGAHLGCWVGGAELWAAAEAGWTFMVRESMVWWKQVWDPLSEWTRKLSRCAELIAAARPTPAQPSHGLPWAVRRQGERAIRSIALHAVGAFYGRAQLVTKSAAFATANIPSDARKVQVEGDVAVWQEDGTSEYSRQLAHPEWSATVWERARTKLATAPTADKGQRAGFLSVDPSQLVGCRTDSLFMTHDPRWADDGKIGRYRRKVLPLLFDAQKWPRSPIGLLELERHAQATAEAQR